MGPGVMRGARWFVAIAVAFASLAHAARGGDDTSAPNAATASRESLKDAVAQLARWCDERKLPVERDLTAQAVLVFDPDDAAARHWLGYMRRKDGTWFSTHPAAPTDSGKDALPEWEKRRAEIADALRAAVAETKKTVLVRETAALRDRACRALLTLVPDDAAARADDGEVFVRDKWLLAESAETAAGRKRIADIADAARKSTANVKVECRTDVDWPVVASLEGLTLRSRLDRRTTENLAKRFLQARRLFADVFGVETSLCKGLEVFALASFDENEAFVAGLSGLTDAQRKSFTQCGSYWMDDERLVLAHDDLRNREDVAVRHALQTMDSPCGPVCAAPPWIGEGAGMYLTYALVKTRLTAFVSNTDYVDQLVSREASDEKADWVTVVRRMIDRGVEPRIPILVGLPLDSMSKEDGLVAYALAAYFLEGRPKDLKSLLVLMHLGHDFHDSLAIICRTDAEGLECRFRRWLRETK